MSIHLINKKLPQIGDNKNFSRFIILTYPRTGSNFLIFKLQFTKKIICYNELFYSKSRIITSYPELRFNWWIIQYRNYFTNSFLNDIFISYSNEIYAVGFKLTYFQDKIFKNKHLIKTLGEKYKVSFIHLKRRNLLKCYISTKLMEENKIVYAIKPKYLNDFKKNTNHFILSSELDHYSPKITVNISEFLSYINKIKSYENEYNQLISSFSHIDLYYEDLFLNTDEELRRIGQLLQIPSLISEEQMEFPIEKLNRKPLKEMISNFSELEEFLYKNNLDVYLKSE